ncbi:MFS transporter [bacterium]|nr:MFS transporter [bacterium]
MSNNKKISRNVFFLGLTSFFNDWSSEMIFPILPAFMAEILGIPKSVIGLIDGVAESLASILKVFSGYVSDRLDRRKNLAVAGYILSTIVKPLLALAQSWLAVFSVRVGDRIGKGIRTAPRDALIAASAESKKRGRSFGFHRAMDTLGALFGTLTTFILLRYILGPQSHRTIFALSAIPAVIGVMFIIFGAKEPKTIRPKEKPKLSWKALPKNLRILIVATFIFGIGNYTFTFFLLRIRTMGIAMAIVPLVYLLYNVVYSAVSYPAGILADKIGKRKVYAIGLVMYILTALGMAFFNASIWAWVLMGTYGLHMGFTNATARALVSDFAPVEIRGTALGMYHTGIGIADLPAGLLAGFLWELYSPKIVFSVGAILATIALLIVLMIKENGKSPVIKKN